MMIAQTFHILEEMRSIDPEFVWAYIERSITEIYRNERLSNAQYMELYRYVFYYCTKIHQPVGAPTVHYQSGDVAGQKLYKKITAFLHNHLIYLLNITKNLRDYELLEFYTDKWRRYKFYSEVLNGACYYFNSFWIKRKIADGSEGIYKIYDLAVVLWRENLFKRLHERIINYSLKLIEMERNGETINKTLMSGAIKSLVHLGYEEEDRRSNINRTDKREHLNVYKEYFEDLYIEQSKRFYQKESAELMGSKPITEYMIKIEQRLKEEMDRINLCFHDSTLKRMSRMCLPILIKQHIDIFQTEFQNLLNDHKTEDLKRMYLLLSLINNGTKELKIMLTNHVHNFGMDSMEKLGDVDGTDPRKYIETIFNVYNRYRKLVTESFGDNVHFMTAFEKGCTKFINKNERTIATNCSQLTAEYLAKYCDLLLKQSDQLNEQETVLELKLTQIRIIFAFIEDKDVFQKFYTKMLAKRLVYQNSVNNDAEAFMISKLKDMCGCEYTNTLQKMFQDISISKDLNNAFKEHNARTKYYCNIDFSILVLCSGAWPLKQNSTFSVPSVFESSIQRFNNFYSTIHSGRKLSWVHTLSKVDIVTNCFKNSYTIQASALQLAVLFQFNDQLSITVKQLGDNTGLAPAILIQILQILLKSKLLHCDNGAKNLESPDTIVKLFLGYKNKKLRININVPLKAEKKIEENETIQYLERDRKCMIEAAIVRIMKSEKVLDHNRLVAELLRQLASRFKAKVPAIKNAIGLLIEKEYIERAKGEREVYKYLA